MTEKYKCLSDLPISISEEALNKLDMYMRLVLEWNKHINLTSITNEDEFIIKHFYDSLTVLCAVDIPFGASVIDIGTGAGFPGIPLKLARPDIKLTLLDSLNKRINFLCTQALPTLKIEARTVHGRAEELSKLKEYRESYDIAVSRAVANLSSLSEYCLPFVKVGGSFVSMKGANAEEELTSAKNAVAVLGGERPTVKNFTLPDGSGRNILIVNKIKHTSDKYPRRGVKINKSPL